ncbi:CoA transferase [Litorivicinus sp.]|nr:CoA transferase [Litorivicinus sp.]MDB9862675.1 CoA transferase [Litorivicinus sp.]MDC1240578.1 CoA transferase [Litorivicinus sp.]
MNDKPLSGFRIIDVTNVLSGPFCSYQLGLLGADIIKVESPDGDLARQLGANPDWNADKLGTSFLAQNAGKKSISIDLKSSRGKAVFQRLVSTADAVVENFRPGVMDRLGLGFDKCQEWSDPIVYCAISGFGQHGPMSGQPAYDQIIQGMSGVMDITGDPASPPYRVGYPIADTIGGLTAALAISSALHQKKSQMIDVSMLESVLTTMGWVVSNWLMAAANPQRIGNENMTSAPSGTFRTQDGLINIAANQEKQWLALVDVCELYHLQGDPRYCSREARKKNRSQLNRDIEEVLGKKSTLDWVELFTENGIPSGPVLTVPEALQLPQVLGREFIVSMAHENPAKKIDLVTNGFLINGDRLKPESGVDQLGESSALILKSIGYSDFEIEHMIQNGVIR